LPDAAYAEQTAKTTLFAGGNRVGSRKNRPTEQAAKTTLFAGGNRVGSRKNRLGDFFQ
jgi:hypothetical protein